MKAVSKLMVTAFIALMIVFSPSCDAMASSNRGYDSNIVKVTGDIYVNEGDMVSGNVVTVWGNVHVNGSVMGNAVAVFGDVIVNGKVMGNAVTAGGRVTVGSTGRIYGNTVDTAGRMFNGEWNRGHYSVPSIIFNPWGRTANVFFSIFSGLIAFLGAALVYVIMPRRLNEMSGSMEASIGRRFGIGALTLIGSPIAMVILTVVLAITIIGIIVIPFAWIAYALAGLVAVVPVYMYIGRKVAESMNNTNMTAFAALAVGILAVWLVKAVASLGGIFTGWINPLLSLAIFILGTGTLVDYVLRAKEKPVQR